MYTSPREVEITKHADLIATAYQDAFKARYKVEPFIETSDLDVFAFLSKNFGLAKGSDLARHYVSMNDEWFIKQAHTPSTMRKNFPRVVADFGLKANRSLDQGLIIKVLLYCDKCHKPYETVLPASELKPENQRICLECA